MQIQFNEADFTPCANGIQAASDALGSAGSFDPSTSSESRAIDAFKERVQEVVRIKQEYYALLQRDSAHLALVSEAFRQADEDAAVHLRMEKERQNEQKANDIITYGTYGNGQARRDALGDDYDDVQRIVNQKMDPGRYGTYTPPTEDDIRGEVAEEHLYQKINSDMLTGDRPRNIPETNFGTMFA